MKSRKTTLLLNQVLAGQSLLGKKNSNVAFCSRDSSPPLLFRIALAALSLTLNKTFITVCPKLNHLFYTDDLKTSSKGDDQQQASPSQDKAS